jgi:hypothetical protein
VDQPGVRGKEGNGVERKREAGHLVIVLLGSDLCRNRPCWQETHVYLELGRSYPGHSSTLGNHYLLPQETYLFCHPRSPVW